MDTELPDIPRKGRGAVSNQTGRFEGYNAVAIDDGWDLPPDEDLPPLRTTVTADATRTIIARNTLAGRAVRPVDQSLSRLRAWLRVLLCPPDPRVSRPVAGARFRK